MKGADVMAKDPLVFKDAEKARDAITQQQKAEIIKTYQKWADEIGEKAKMYSHKTAPSYAIAERQMKELEKQLRATSDKVANEIYGGIKSSIYTVSEAVVNTNKEWLKGLGFEGETLDIAFNYVPDEMVQKLVTGQIYDSGWSLSKRIWDDKEETLSELYKITAGGVAQNKSIYEIAKDLEKYVSPTAAKPWNLVDKDGKKIYPKQVDYNAQRLARTLVQHGYQQSFVETTKENPFIIDYVWNSNGSRACELCMDRDGTHYKKHELPMDHPNGMCTMEPNVSETLVDDLANWFNEPVGSYPEIDKFAESFGHKEKVAKTAADFIDKYGTSIKSPNAWYTSLSPMQKSEAKLLKEQSGLTWNSWYEKNIYAGDGSNLGKKKVAKAKQVSDFFNKQEWLDLLNQNDLSEMENWCDDWLKVATKKEKNAVVTYTGSAYRDMNSYLRGINSSTNYEDEIKAAISGLGKASIPKDTIARRGSSFNSLKRLLNADAGSEIIANQEKYIGMVIQDKGFMSASPDPHGGFTGEAIEYVIKVPKGTNAMYVDSISKHRGEKELLLNAGTKFIVEDFELNNSGSRIKKVFIKVINK